MHLRLLSLQLLPVLSIFLLSIFVLPLLELAPLSASAQDICVDCDPAPVVDKSDVIGITYNSGYASVNRDELASFLIERFNIATITEKAHTIKLAYGIGYLDEDLQPRTSRVTVTAPLLTIPGKPALVERGSGPVDAAFKAFEDPSFGFEDPSFGFEDPSFGFEDPSFGFEDPSFGFEDPSFGFEDPSFGFETPQATLDAIWGTNGTAYQDEFTNGIWGVDGVSFRALDPNSVWETNGVWGTTGVAYKPFALIVFTVDADAALSHSGLIVPFTVPEFAIKTNESTLAQGIRPALQSQGFNMDSAETGPGLEAAYPNPFNPQTRLTFSLARDGLTRLAVYNLLGRQVAELVNGAMTAGQHAVNFDASSLPSGAYLVRLEAGGIAQTKRITLLK